MAKISAWTLLYPWTLQIGAWSPHDSKQKHICVQFMHRWQMKFSCLFKAFSIHLFSLKPSGEDFSAQAITPHLFSLSLSLSFKIALAFGSFIVNRLTKILSEQGRERRKPEGRINEESWFYFPVFEGRTDVYEGSEPLKHVSKGYVWPMWWYRKPTKHCLPHLKMRGLGSVWCKVVYYITVWIKADTAGVESVHWVPDLYLGV